MLGLILTLGARNTKTTATNVSVFGIYCSFPYMKSKLTHLYK